MLVLGLIYFPVPFLMRIRCDVLSSWLLGKVASVALARTLEALPEGDPLI